MNPAIWLGLGVLAIALVAVIVWSATRRTDAQLSAVRQEMQNSLTTQSQTVLTQMNSLMQSVTQQLGQVRHDASRRRVIRPACKLCPDGNGAAAPSIERGDSQNQYAACGSAEIGPRSFAVSANSSERPRRRKTRGSLGEVALEVCLKTLCREALTKRNSGSCPPGQSSMPSFIVGERLLSIDSKFALEAYRRLVETGSDAQRELSRPFASMPIRSRKNTFCPMSIR